MEPHQYAGFGSCLQNIGYPRETQSVQGDTRMAQHWTPKEENKTGAVDTCPRCALPHEDQDHVLLCQADWVKAVRYNATVCLRSLVVTKGGGSNMWTYLHAHLSQWLQWNLDPKVPLTLLKEDTHLHGLLNRAVNDQQRIGWSQMWRGYLSMAWTEAFMHERKCIFVTAHQQWTKHAITALWNTVDLFWTHCNQVLKAKEHLAQQIRESPMDTQIRNMYNQKGDFAATDKEIFTYPLVEMLNQSARWNRYWLARIAKKYYETTLQRKRGNQPKVTSIFCENPIKDYIAPH